MTTTRIRAGLYEVRTRTGVFTVESIPMAGWFITFPGCSKADDWADTLAEAKVVIGYEEVR